MNKKIVRKNIKLISIIFLAVLFFQPAFGQSIDQEGRAPGFKRSPVQKEVKSDAKTKAVFGVDVADVPGSFGARSGASTVGEDIVFPSDFDALVDEVSSVETAERLAQLEEELKKLAAFNEQLRLENRTIKKSLSNCCSSATVGLSTKDAYLLQNAPNPFKQATVVNYFIPDGAKEARLEIRDVKGELKESIAIEHGGFGNIDLEAQKLQTGTYVYSLYIGEEIIDTKVMVITQ